MMKPTARLQFVRRQEGKEVVRVLQQEWVDEDPRDEGPIRFQWRDVPCVDSTQTSSMGTK